MTEKNNCVLSLVTRLCLVMLFQEALPDVIRGGSASLMTFPGSAWERGNKKDKGDKGDKGEVFVTQIGLLQLYKRGFLVEMIDQINRCC